MSSSHGVCVGSLSVTATSWRSVGGGRAGRCVEGGVRRADGGHSICCIVHAAARRCHGWYAAAALGWVVVCMACACDDACALDGGGSNARAAHEEWWWGAGRVAMRRGVHGAADIGMPLPRRCWLLSLWSDGLCLWRNIFESSVPGAPMCTSVHVVEGPGRLAPVGVHVRAAGGARLGRSVAV